MKRLACRFAVAFAFATPAFAAPAFHAAGDARWACGGVGADERRALDALRPQSNVELLFVSAERGGYLADASFKVSAGARTLFASENEGPICLLALPAGAYRIEARRGEVVRTQSLQVGAKAGPRRVVFSFPGEPWDGISASEEEKRQAREP